ncbi:MAG: hypothetical protein ACTHJ9_16250 [Rhodanobacter sp.]
MTNPIEAPNASKGDIVHALAKAGLSAIPILGGPAAELFQLVIQPPLERRRAEWMAAIGEKLQELEDRGVPLDDLAKNEEFISAVMHASNMALRTHQQEKLEALRNAVLNVAVGQAPDDALQHMFFRWIESLSPLHLRVLKLFQAPTSQSGLSMGGLNSVLEHNMPELRGKRHIYDQVWKDLYSSGLVNTENLHVTMSGNGLTAKRTSELGDAFIAFIAEPAMAAAR